MFSRAPPRSRWGRKLTALPSLLAVFKGEGKKGKGRGMRKGR